MWVPILMYHRVSDEPDPLKFNVTPVRFEAQLRWLLRHGYQSLSLHQLALVFDDPAKEALLPPHPVVLTFDDGYYDNYSVAFPLLKRYGFAATIFLVTDSIGRDSCFDRALPAGWRPYPLLGAEQIREMKAAGIEFGSHSATHAVLTELKPAAMREEVTQSRQALEQLLEQKVEIFCYPHSKTSPAVQRAVKEAGYRLACAGRGAKFDRFCLNRIEANNLDPFQLAIQTSPAFRRLRRTKLWITLRQRAYHLWPDNF